MLKTQELEAVDAALIDEEPVSEIMNLTDALDHISSHAVGSELKRIFWKRCKRQFTFLEEMLGLTPFQSLFIAMLIENGEGISWKGMANSIGCTRLSLMKYVDDVEDLLAKGWLMRGKVNRNFETREGFVLEDGVLDSLCHNKPFVPKKIDGLSIQEFMDCLERKSDRDLDSHRVSFEDFQNWMLHLCNANPSLPLCHTALQQEFHDMTVFLLIATDYARWADSDGEGLYLDTISDLLPSDFDCNNQRQRLQNGSHALITNGLIEHTCEDGIANNKRYSLTRKTKEELLAGYNPSRSQCPITPNQKSGLKAHTQIKEKQMFYNQSEEQQIERLTHLLSTDSFSSVQARLEEEGYRKGVACLFYGAPGTGKTETVLQLARATGRDIMQIDIAGIRDKFVGESEKNIKAIFSRYRNACKESEVTPILFFNEADAIISKRTQNIDHSVDKMNNAMQNIILEEMEKLDGILIATTNLTSNLDSAFDRRFLFKIEFNKPDTDVKAKLWTSMLGKSLTEQDAETLAERYDFSGGQIENIARKRAIEYILSGKEVTFSGIDDFCKQEVLNANSCRKTIGFQ